MPVEFIKEKGGASRRIKFVRNTAYNGTDYYIGDEVDVDAAWATRFIMAERAVAVEEEKASSGGPATGEPQIRDPQAQNRDPQLPLDTAAKKK
jgi:hypothetical protein